MWRKRQGLLFIVLEKVRHGDRDVEVSVPDVDKYKESHPLYWLMILYLQPEP